MNSWKMTQILSLFSNLLQVLWLQIETGKINRFLVQLQYTEISLLERRNFKQSFGGNVNARGALDQN